MVLMVIDHYIDSPAIVVGGSRRQGGTIDIEKALTQGKKAAESAVAAPMRCQ